jgi:hypothetical protein
MSEDHRFRRKIEIMTRRLDIHCSLNYLFNAVIIRWVRMQCSAQVDGVLLSKTKQKPSLWRNPNTITV